MQNDSDTRRQYALRLPPDVTEACASYDPERVFAAASNHYEPVVLGLMTQPPYSGGPLMGFSPVIDGVRCVMNGFCVSYFDESGYQKSKVLGLDDIVKLSFTCISAPLAQAMRVADESKAAIAAAQVPQVDALLKAAGVGANAS